MHYTCITNEPRYILNAFHKGSKKYHVYSLTFNNGSVIVKHNEKDLHEAAIPPKNSIANLSCERTFDFVISDFKVTYPIEAQPNMYYCIAIMDDRRNIIPMWS